MIELGAYWLLDEVSIQPRNSRIMPSPAANFFVTRLHARYDETSFSEDLMLQVTEDRENFQGRYIMRHPWTGEATCKAAEEYFYGLVERFEREAQTLARFTRWDVAEIREKMKATGQDASFRPVSKPWRDRMWNR